MSQYSVFFFFFFFFLKLLLFLWYPALNLILCLFFPKSGVDLYRESTPGGPVFFFGGSGHPLGPPVDSADKNKRRTICFILESFTGRFTGYL